MTHRLIRLAAVVTTASLIAASAVGSSAGASNDGSADLAAAVSASVIHGDCQGGGSVVLRVEARGDKYVMTASATNLPVDGRWRGGLGEDSERDPDAFEGRGFRATAVDGSWNVIRRVPALELPYFTLAAFGPGRIDIAHGRLCTVLIRPTAPFAGVTWCHGTYSLAMAALRRADGRWVLRYLSNGGKRDSRWTATAVASEGDRRMAVSSPEVAHGKYGGYSGKVAFSGLTDSRFRVTVTADSGRHCSLLIRRWFDPSFSAPRQLDESVSPAATMRALHDLVAAQRTHLEYLR